jgi:formylglycine-generating enzyme required for sulfatase activity
MPQPRLIPADEFVMGESEADKFANDTERPRHVVRIAAFRLAAFPVTNAEFRRHVPGFAADEPADWPAVNVSWREAVAYCAWLGDTTGETVRLPSEAEWEYACRAGAVTPFHSGAEITPAEANFLFDENGLRIGRGTRTPAGTFAPNAFGLESMHGNICEWCADTWHPSYHGAPADGSAWMGAETRRVIRGGAWDYLPRLLRSSWRDALPETTRRDNVGFRIVAA